jgi:protein ImuB
VARWVEQALKRLEHLGWAASAVWGCSAYGAALLAEDMPAGAWSYVPLEHESVRLDPLPLRRLRLGQRADEGLARFGLRHLRDLKRVPRNALNARYGSSLKRKMALLAGASPHWTFDQPEEPLCSVAHFEEPLVRVDALLFELKAGLSKALETLSEQGRACARIVLTLREESDFERTFELRPAQPTLDEERIMDLLRLRLSAQRIQAPLVACALRLDAVPAWREQLQLFAQAGLDPRRRDEGLDRLRAELGEGAVWRAQMRCRHHPQEAVQWVEQSGCWPVLKKSSGRPSLVRRILAEPRSVEGPSKTGPWRVLGDVVAAVGGPYPLQQNWWRRWRADDEYLVRTRAGRVFWLMHDRLTARWWLIGWVA